MKYAVMTASCSLRNDESQAVTAACTSKVIRCWAVTDAPKKRNDLRKSQLPLRKDEMLAATAALRTDEIVGSWSCLSELMRCWAAVTAASQSWYAADWQLPLRIGEMFGSDSCRSEETAAHRSEVVTTVVRSDDMLSGNSCCPWEVMSFLLMAESQASDNSRRAKKLSLYDSYATTLNDTCTVCTPG